MWRWQGSSRRRSSLQAAWSTRSRCRRGSSDWADLLASGEGQSRDFESLEANEPAWILATSGTTAKPKLTVQRHGGYAVGIHAMARWVFGMRPEDVWWSTSDIGWVVGHSYIVYAPLLIGCTTVAYEGALDYPEPDGLWRAAEELGVTGIFTSPTAVRQLMRYGGGRPSADLSALTRVVCAGEVLNPPAWEWLQKEVLGDRIPVIDHWWQTETGGPVLGNPFGLAMVPIKPGSAGIPLPGMDAAVMTPDGRGVRPGREGDPRSAPAVSEPDRDALGRAGAVRRPTTGSASPGSPSTTRATRPRSTRTGTSGSRAAPTR